MTSNHYVVYDVASTMQIGETLPTHRRAVNFFEKMKTREALRQAQNPHSSFKRKFAMVDIETYRTKVVFKKTVKSLMSGKDVEIDSNTPCHLDPSSETYWSA